MKKLFLVSSFQDTANLFTKFEQDLCGKTVTFIPTASKVEEVVFYVAAGRQALERMGLRIDELDIATATFAAMRAKITSNDFIYVTGGNTFYLLQELKRTGADQLIIDEVRAGKLYIGESAGAIVAAPHIDYVRDMDCAQKAPLLEDSSGLDLVSFYPVPHHTNPPFAASTQKIIKTYSSRLPLLPISNTDAILVNNNAVKIEHS